MMRKLDDEAMAEVARYFSALAVPTRLKILNALREGEHNVTELTRVAGCTQANASKHLAVLSLAGMVGKSQRGNSVYYRIADARVYGLCDVVCGQIGRRYGELALRRRMFARRSPR